MAMLFGDVTYPGTLLMSQPGFSLLSRLPTKQCHSLSVQPVCLEYIVGDIIRERIVVLCCSGCCQDLIEAVWIGNEWH